MYLRWHFCSLRRPKLYMYSWAPLIFLQILILQQLSKIYCEVWKSSSNLFTWPLWLLPMPCLPVRQILQLWRVLTHSLPFLQLKEIIQEGIITRLVLQLLCRSSFKKSPVRIWITIENRLIIWNNLIISRIPVPVGFGLKEFYCTCVCVLLESVSTQYSRYANVLTPECHTSGICINFNPYLTNVRIGWAHNNARKYRIGRWDVFVTVHPWYNYINNQLDATITVY